MKKLFLRTTFCHKTVFKQVFVPTQDAVLNWSGCVTPANHFPTRLSIEKLN